MEKHNIYHFSQAWISKIAKQPSICFNLYLSIYLEETCILNSVSIIISTFTNLEHLPELKVWGFKLLFHRLRDTSQPPWTILLSPDNGEPVTQHIWHCINSKNKRQKKKISAVNYKIAS